MSLFDGSSSPLSTLIPSSDPYTLPDYTNAFSLSSTPSYGDAFMANMLPMLNRISFQTGLAMTLSSNPLEVALGGNKMSNIISLYTNSFTNNSNNSVSSLFSAENLNLGFSALGQIGAKTGGIAGNIMQGGSKLGSSINNLVSASKAAGGFKNLTGSAKGSGVGAAIGAVADIASSFMPEKTEYSGDKGNITLTMDSVYDGIADAAMAIPGWGTLVGGIMKGGKLLGQGVNALGGGTDGMTTTDAILGSAFFNLTPLGLINGFGGKKANTITKNEEAFEQVGSSYTGTNDDVDDALHYSGKKYGLFSRKALNKVNQKIDEANRQQDLVTNIANEAKDNATLQTTMSGILANRRKFEMQGGYNQAAVRAGRRGMLLEKARKIIKALKGKKITSEITNKKTRSLEELIELAKQKNPRFILRMSEPFKYLKMPDGSIATHLMSWVEVDGKPFIYSLIQEDENGDLKNYGREAIKRALENHNGFFVETPEEADLFTISNDIEHGYKSGWKDFFNLAALYKNGGSVILLVDYKELPEFKNGGSVIELTKESVIELVDPSTIPEFLNGGSFNVIPEGALHARKHNMELEGITQKGIPVVSENSDGSIELQAEVEKEELILRLEVTQKLEELEKKYYDKESSLKEKDEYALEAGKLITEELLHNTKDNAGLL